MQNSPLQAPCLIPLLLYKVELLLMPASPREPLRMSELGQHKTQFELLQVGCFIPNKVLVHVLLANAHVWRFQFPGVS